MRVCDVVKNSIWYDPRVKKQIYEYLNNNVELFCVGIKEPRYVENEVQKMPCKIVMVDIDERYYSDKRTILTKIIREIKINSRLYKAILETQPDIIHANDLDTLIPSYKASKKLKCRIIYDTHEIFLENLWVKNNKITKYIWGFFEKRIIKKVDKVVCVSHASSEYLQKKYGIDAPMIVTNCISSTQVINYLVKKSEKLEVLNHGQFYGGRGYDIMIEAAKYLIGYADIEFVLRGFGSMEDMLRKKVVDDGIKNVRFAPPVKVEELIPEAAKAWVGLAITEASCLNFELSVSNKLFEYAAAGLPVVMSDIPEHRYLNQKYDFGIILENNSPKCLADTISRMYKSTELYERLKSSSERLSHEVTWENEFAHLMEMERSLLSGY